MAKSKRKKEQEHKSFALQKPELTVLTDHSLEPKETYLDSFNLRYRLGPVYDILRYPETKTPMTIAVYGDWGAGKTTAMKWLHSLIDEWNAGKDTEKKIRIKPVWFYPWKYDNKEDVCRGLISEVIVNSIDVKDASIQTVKNAAKRFGLFLGRSFLHVLAGIKLKAKVPGDTAEADVDLASIKEILAEYHEAAHPEKAYLNEFESSLESWVKTTLGENERMVIFIDDLDRCMPEIALQVLESLKLYLNIEKLVFVVGVDRGIVDKLVRGHYERLGLDESKSRNYLAKMFQVEVQVEPSEHQISAFLDEQLTNIPYWKKPHLEKDERDMFRNIIFKLAERNPREVKRLINSAMMMGAGAVMMRGPKDEGGIDFKQGLQLFFVHKILADRYTMGSLVGSDRGDEFFRGWSEIVCEGRKKDKNFPCTVKVPEGFGQEISKEMDLEEKTQRRLDKTPASFRPEEYQPLLKEPKFQGLLHLLRDRDLGELMRIEYPSEAEATEITAVVGTSKDVDIIREAIARQLGKKPEELNEEDYERVARLDLFGTQVSNLEPLKALSSLQYLDLSETQVNNLEPIRALSSLRYLDLSETAVSNLEPIKALSRLGSLGLEGTQVSDEEVEKLKRALPGVEIYR